MNIPVHGTTGLVLLDRLQIERDHFFSVQRGVLQPKKVGPSTPERRQSVIRNPWHSSLQLSCLLPKTPSPRSQIGSLAEHGSKTIIAWREGVLFAVQYCTVEKDRRRCLCVPPVVRNHPEMGIGRTGRMYRVRAYRDSEYPELCSSGGCVNDFDMCAVPSRNPLIGPGWGVSIIAYRSPRHNRQKEVIMGPYNRPLAATCTIEEAGDLKKESR